MTRYKDNRFCEYVYADDSVWTLCGETLVTVYPEKDDEPAYTVKRKNLNRSTS